MVGDDVPVDDWDRVMWSLAVRFDPKRDAQMIDRGRSTPLDPALPITARHITSRILMDACTPFEWERKPIEIFLDEDMKKKVLARWKEYGFEDWSAAICKPEIVGAQEVSRRERSKCSGIICSLYRRSCTCLDASAGRCTGS